MLLRLTNEEKMHIAIVGGGHNGLICAAYLARARGAASKIGSVTVFERRSIVGGAAVTEEIIPDFKFSRFSYLAGLLRPDIVDDLGLEYVSIPRNPSSFTPTQTPGRYLMLSSDAASNRESIAQFSTRDAERYDEYEEMLAGCRECAAHAGFAATDPRALALGRGVTAFVLGAQQERCVALRLLKSSGLFPTLSCLLPSSARLDATLIAAGNACDRQRDRRAD